MSVLVDTSVWVRFLANQVPYAAQLDDLLSRDEVSGHDLVYGELLIGDRGGRKQLLANYELMDRAPVVSHAAIVTFVRDRKLSGTGIGWIDAHLLAAALVGRLKLWTADAPLAAAATALGIAFE
jgi:predicted nucleic acid-binding protein